MIKVYAGIGIASGIIGMAASIHDHNITAALWAGISVLWILNLLLDRASR